MARIKYDVTDVEAGFPVVKPGLYQCKITEVTKKESKAGNEMLEVVLTITTKGDFKGARLMTWIVTDDENAAFRMAELIKAIGARKKGTLDTDKIVGEEVQVRVKSDTFEGEPRARVGTILPVGEDPDEDEDLDDEDDDDDDDDDGEDYSDMSIAELREECEERDLSTKGKKAQLVARLEDDDEEGDDEEEDEDEEDEDEEPEYETMSVQDLKDELKERELKTTGPKKILIKRLEKDDEEDAV